MKSLLTTLFVLTVSVAALAQRSSVSKNIIVDDLIMTIKVDIEEPGRSLHYHKRFNIEGLGQEERQALENRILDSLGVNVPVKSKRFNDGNSPVASAHGVVISSRTKEYGSNHNESESTTINRDSGQQENMTISSHSESKDQSSTTLTTTSSNNGDAGYSKQIKDDPETGGYLCAIGT